MFCCECGSEMRFTDEPISEEFRGELITVEGIERHVCDQCGNDVMSAEMATKLSMGLASEYARRSGLLAPEEIKAIRKQFDLTQADLEKIAGVSSPAVCRWERGAALQSGSADLLLRMFRGVPEARRFLMDRAGLSKRKNANKAARDMISGKRSSILFSHAEQFSFQPPVAEARSEAERPDYVARG